MKILAAIIITILVLATAAVGIAIFWLDTASFKTQIESSVKNATGKSLQIEGVPEISIFPLGFKIGTAFWGYKDGKPNQYGVSVAIKGSSLSIDFLPLFSKKVIVNSISLVEPQINIFAEKKAQTKGNQTKSAQINDTSQVESVALDEKTENFAVELKNVRIQNASMLLKNIEGMEIEINGLNASIKNLRPNELGTIEINTNVNLKQIKDKQILFAGNVDLKTSLMFDKDKISVKQANLNVNVQKNELIKLSEPIKISANGVYFIKTKQIELGDMSISSNFTNFSLKNRIGLSAVGTMGSQNAVAKPAAVGDAVGTDDFKSESKLIGVADAAEAVDIKNLGKQNFLGDFTLQINLVELLKVLQINMPDKQIPKNLNLAGMVNYTKSDIYLKDIKGKIDNTNITAYLNIFSFASKEKMNIVGKFNLGKINADAYMAKPAKAVQKDADQVQKLTQKTSQAQEVAQELAQKGSQKAIQKSVQATNMALPKGLPNMNLEFNIDSLSIESIVLKKIHAIIISDSGIYKLLPIKLNLATGGTLSGNVVGNSINNSYDISIMANQVNIGNFLQAFQGNSKVSGLAFLNTKLKTTGTNISKLKANLSGTGQLTIQNITLNNMSFMPKAIFGNNIIPTKFDELKANFVSKKGIITVNPIRLLEKKAAKVQKFGGLGNAIINLPTENLKLNMLVKLDKVSIPMLISGPFSKLSYGLDAEKLAQEMIEGTINNAVESLKKGEIDKNTIKNIFRGIIGQ